MSRIANRIAGKEGDYSLARLRFLFGVIAGAIGIEDDVDDVAAAQGAGGTAACPAAFQEASAAAGGAETGDGAKGNGNDTLYDCYVANTLKGGLGTDVMTGGRGSDRIEGGADKDILFASWHESLGKQASHLQGRARTAIRSWAKAETIS